MYLKFKYVTDLNEIAPDKIVQIYFKQIKKL